MLFLYIVYEVITLYTIYTIYTIKKQIYPSIRSDNEGYYHVFGNTKPIPPWGDTFVGAKRTEPG